MGGGGGGIEKLKVPDWRTQTIGDHTPELKEIERRLKMRGLKDPWLRNEAWRYAGYSKRQMWTLFFHPRAAVVGVGVALVTSQIQKYWDRQWIEAHGGHGHH